MRRHLKNYFIPHEGNDNKPHVLRELSVLALTLIIVLAFGFSVFQAVLVRTTPEFMAAVVPAVLVDLANEDRQSADLSHLAVNPVLEEAARMKAEHMAENEYFAHTSPDGLSPWYWFYRAGYQFITAGENLAVNFVDSEDVEEAWMDSPGHRANIMNDAFTEIGIAAVSGTYKGKRTIYVVQLFGTPAQGAAQAAVTPSAPVAPIAFATPEPETNVAGAETESPTDVLGAEAADVEVVSEEVSDEAPQKVAVATEMFIETADAQEMPSVSKNTELTNNAPVFDQFLSHPRAVVKWVYIAIGLIIALVLLLMVLRRVHRLHSRNMLYGAALLVLLVLLFYFNYLLLAGDLFIV